MYKELVNKILSFGEFWDFQHEEIFFKNDLCDAKRITKQDQFEGDFQALLMNVYTLALKIKRIEDNKNERQTVEDVEKD